ncbi:ATP-binding protein [Halobacteriales archaeon QS_9_67_17]|nr:MAG: ATP-binding protein [Halobacteriales archaeon QS_9_67_17]
MDNQPFPSDVSEWSWDTVESLAESGQSENLYLEYKRHLQHPDNNTEKSETEWKRNVEREFTAFANASGGIIVFGMSDNREPAPFEPLEHEVSQAVSQLIQNTAPLVETDVSGPLRVPSDGTDRIALAVRVYEATRKPVTTSDSAYYVRINDQKQPMNREQIESLFVEADRQQQAVRQLEMEINRFYEIIDKEDSKFSIHGKAPPNYHLLNIESLKEVLRENTHLFSDEEVSEAISRVFTELRRIEDREVYLDRAIDGHTPKYAEDNKAFYKSERNELSKRLSRLKRELEILAKQADLQVKRLDE